MTVTVTLREVSRYTGTGASPFSEGDSGPLLPVAPNAPFPLNTLLKKITVPSEALLNKPVDCVLLGVCGAW